MRWLGQESSTLFQFCRPAVRRSRNLGEDGIAIDVGPAGALEKCRDYQVSTTARKSNDRVVVVRRPDALGFSGCPGAQRRSSARRQTCPQPRIPRVHFSHFREQPCGMLFVHQLPPDEPREKPPGPSW